MEFFKTNTKIDFMRQRKWAALFSTVLFVLSIGALLYFHLNLGLDFTGGTEIEVTYTQSAQFNEIRQALSNVGFDEAVVLPYGASNTVMIRLGVHENLTQEQLIKQVMDALPGAKKESANFIGPQVGKKLVTNGVLAILVCLLATMLYIALRFEYRFAVSAAVALIHDPILILGIFALFHLEFNLITLAALLTIIGYSLNDTVVVYDRARENFRKLRKGTPLEVMNLSINQTLSRTIMTSSLTLMVVVALYIYGGQTLRGFALALIIGIFIGTYSSIYVAGSLAVAMGLNRNSLLPAAKKPMDDLP